MILLNAISFSWIVFIAFWIVMAFRAKKSVDESHRPWLAMRLVMLVVIFFIFSFPPTRTLLSHPSRDPLLLWVGTLFTVVGIGIALWARIYLGSNWGMPMSERESHALITTGPYRYVRHPIYSGVLLALLGSGCVIPMWWVFFIMFSAYFIFAAYGEEKSMARLFPDTYSAYKKHTRMLVPGVF